MKKVTDFNNTWCEATEENYGALTLKIEDKSMTKQGRLNFSKPAILFIEDGVLNSGSFSFSSGKIEIKLIDNEFYYVDEETEENSFNKFGFETPDFEGEILKEVYDLYIGYVVSKDNDAIPVQWSVLGTCYDSNGQYLSDYNLMFISKPWYENEDNIGKLLIKKDTNLFFIFIGYIENNFATIDLRNGIKCTFENYIDLRPATEEEVLNLVVKEKK